MVMSKSQCDDALCHILKEVLDEDDDVCQALNYHGIDSPQALCSLEDFEIIWLTNPDEEDTISTLGMFSVERIRAFKAFIAHLTSIGKEIKDDQWTSISNDEYEAFKGSLVYQKTNCQPQYSGCIKKPALFKFTSSPNVDSSLTSEEILASWDGPNFPVATSDAQCLLPSAIPVPMIPPVLTDIGIQSSMVPSGFPIPVITPVPQVPPKPPETCFQALLVPPCQRFHAPPVPPCQYCQTALVSPCPPIPCTIPCVQNCQ